MNQIKNYFASLFGQPSFLTLASLELQDAERDLLVAESSMEYYGRMMQYQTDRIKRLKQHIANGSPKLPMIV